MRCWCMGTQTPHWRRRNERDHGIANDEPPRSSARDHDLQHCRIDNRGRVGEDSVGRPGIENVFKHGIHRALRARERVEAAKLRGKPVAICGANGVGVYRIGIVCKQFLSVVQTVVVRVGVVRVGVVEEKLVNSEKPVAVRILIVGIALR